VSYRVEACHRLAEQERSALSRALSPGGKGKPWGGCEVFNGVTRCSSC